MLKKSSFNRALFFSIITYFLLGVLLCAIYTAAKLINYQSEESEYLTLRSIQIWIQAGFSFFSILLFALPVALHGRSPLWCVICYGATSIMFYFILKAVDIKFAFSWKNGPPGYHTVFGLVCVVGAIAWMQGKKGAARLAFALIGLCVFHQASAAVVSLHYVGRDATAYLPKFQRTLITYYIASRPLVVRLSSLIPAIIATDWPFGKRKSAGQPAKTQDPAAGPPD